MLNHSPLTSPPSVRRRALGALAGTAIAMLTLAACASAEEPTSTATAQAQDDAGFPEAAGLSGLIAAVGDGTLQVQSDDGQTAVRYTDATTITKTVTADISQIAVGDCVTVSSGEDESATTITVTAAVDGECDAGFGGGSGGGSGGGERPSGEPTAMPEGDEPSDMPSGDPSGAPQGGGFGGFTTGAVTAVSSDALTVETTDADGATSSTEVVLSAETVVTTTADGTTADIAQGLCVTATGEADDAGGYDATALALSDADEDGECTTGGGFGGGPGGGGRPGEESTDE